jgi:hypothetical protein
VDTLADREFELIHPTRRRAELLRIYHDLLLGAVDGCVVALAERVGDLSGVGGRPVSVGIRYPRPRTVRSRSPAPAARSAARP